MIHLIKKPKVGPPHGSHLKYVLDVVANLIYIQRENGSSPNQSNVSKSKRKQMIAQTKQHKIKYRREPGMTAGNDQV